MKHEIFVNVSPRETRVAVREADKIVELLIERDAERGVAGGIYKGKVTRVLPGMQASFVDIGLERGAFLYVGDYRAELDGVDVDDEGSEGRRSPKGGNGGRGRRGNSMPQIEEVLEEGQEVLVQVSKEPLGTKGARITSRVSLAGRHLVLVPWMQRVGISRRIGSDRERRRLRSIVAGLRREDLGFIVRTVSHGVTESDLQADVEYLTTLWDGVNERRQAAKEVPARVYEEPKLHLRILRDLVSSQTKSIVVDDANAYGEMQEFVHKFMASPRPRITHYKNAQPLYERERIEQQIEEGLSRKVWLKSGGSLIIDQSEALTAIDVNTGRFTGGKGRNLEETILKTNMEAVREIAHQLRFRNIGGLIILDLIDMDQSTNREKVYKALLDAVREDKANTNLLKISELGLVEMTRKRTRENLVQQLCDPCSTCEGRGYLQSSQTICNKILRELPKAADYVKGKTLMLRTHPEVAELLFGVESEAIHALETRISRVVAIRADPRLHREQFEITATP